MSQLQRARNEIMLNILVRGRINDISTVELDYRGEYYACNYDNNQVLVTYKEAEHIKQCAEYLIWNGDAPQPALTTYYVGSLPVTIPNPHARK